MFDSGEDSLAWEPMDDWEAEDVGHAMGEKSAGCIKYSVLMATGYGISKTPSISFHMN